MDLIHFSNGEYPQYSACEYAKVTPNAEKWAEGFNVIRCCHPESKYALCVSNYQFNTCLNGKKVGTEAEK
jgi:hypothetical protein